MDWQYEDGRVCSIDETGELLAEVTYVKTADGEVDINHTYVNPKLRGQGVAGELMQVVSEFLRKNELKATATCSYAAHWLEKNKEAYADIIA